MEQPILINLTHERDHQFVQVAKGDVVFWVNGQECQFPTLHAAEVITMLAESHPATVHTEDLYENLNRQLHVGERGRLAQTVYKYVSQARNALRNAGIQAGLIQTLRNYGYRFSPGWTVGLVEEPPIAMARDLKELKLLVDCCILGARHAPIQVNPQGLMYLNMNRSQQYENFLILERLGWQIVQALSSTRSLHLALSVKNDLDKLLTYVLFWRAGEKMSESEWKQHYENEILELFSDIEMRAFKGTGFGPAYRGDRLVGGHSENQDIEP